MAWYKAGNVTVTNGSTAVTGTGTRFASNARVGDSFRGPDGYFYEIINIASETTFGIAPAYQGASVANSTNYVIAPIQGYVKESADRLRLLTDGLDDISADVEAADASAQAAAASEAAAAASEIAAKTSETNSKTSETNSKTSETNAKASETAADASKTAAAGSQTAAATSATNANTSATNASNSAAAALASQNAAKTSETNSKTSETNSKTSETNSKASETAADASKTAAATSATNAASANTSAQSAKTAAETAQAAAEASQAAAASSEASAADSESMAQAWATNAVDSAVETDKYSALHWATKAAESAAQAGNTIGTRLNSIAQAVTAVNDILIADSTTTMAKLATGAMGRTLLGTADAAGAQTAIGATTVGKSLITATDDAAGRTALGLGTVATESTVPVSKGGTGATDSAGARTNLGLGNAATRNVTTSTSDTTTGSILKVGDFGIGALDNPFLTDLTGAWYVGFYRVPANSPGLPSDVATLDAIFIALRQNFGILLSAAAGMTRRMFHGARSGTTGAATWREVVNSDEFGTFGKTLAASTTQAAAVQGLGLTTPIITGGSSTTTDFNTLTESGWQNVLYSRACPNSPGSNSKAAYFYLFNMVYSAQVTQIAFPYGAGSGSTVIGRFYMRSRYNSVWYPWQVNLTNTDIVGTTTLDSYTSAIIERGSNANGEYVRYADGTQICWNRSETAVTTTTAVGNIFSVPSLTSFNFPIAFTSPPRVTDGSSFINSSGSAAGSARAWGGAISNSANSSCSMAYLGGTSASGTFPGYMAIGRWY